MKKILFALAAAAMVLGVASCQKENLGKINGIKTNGKTVDVIKVMAGPDTRLAIDKKTLTPEFEVEDEIFGWSKDGINYTFKCTAVDEATGIATFGRISEQGPSAEEGTLINLIYAPGSKAEDVAENALVVDLSQQGETLPVVMSGSGVVDSEGNCQVVFTNNVAIVEVKDALFPWVAEGEEFAIDFYGKYNSLKFELDKVGALAAKPAAQGWISSTVKSTANSESKISAKFAVPADGSDILVSIKAKASDGSAYAFSAGEKKISSGKYINVPGKVFTPQYVAHISQKGYLLFSKAVEAANASKEDVTITMLENIEAEAGAIIKNEAGKKVTLDLQGKEIKSSFKVYTDFEVVDETGNGVIEAASNTIKVGEEDKGVKATLTINGGTIKALDGNYAIAADGTKNGDQPTVLVKKGALIAEKGNASRSRYTKSVKYGDDTDGDIVVVSKGGLWISYSQNVEINKGTYLSTDKCFYFGNSTCKVTVNDGTFTTAGPFITYNSTSINPELTIKNGKFAWGSGKDFAQTAHTNTQVSGGYFTEALPDFCVVGGCACVPTSEIEGYSYKVISDSYVAMVGDTKYEDIKEAMNAINAATEPATLQLLKDVTLASNDSLIFTNSAADIKLDLNGMCISTSGSKVPSGLVVTSARNLTIMDSGDGGKIDQQTAGNGYALSVRSGICNVTGGTITHSKSTGYFNRNAIKVWGTDAEATLNISGGTITSGGRVIVFGSGNEACKTFVNISGGLIKARADEEKRTDNSDMAVIWCKSEYGYLTMTGGTVYAFYQPAIYLGADNCRVVIKKDGGSVPYIYQKYPNHEYDGSTGRILKASNGDVAKLFSVQGCYTTGKNVNYKAILGSTSVDEVSGVKDAYGNKYTYHIYIESVLKVGEKEFASAVDAMDEANSATAPTTIKVLKDFQLEHPMIFTNEVAPLTLDLNGKTVKAPAWNENVGDTTAVLVNAANVDLTIMDSSGDDSGTLDQVRDGEAYTLTVHGGNVKIVSGTVCNSTTPGYGRMAIRADAQKGPSVTTISGGHVYGGRAIRIGSGKSANRSKVVITGGLVEGKYAATSTSYYAPLSFERGYGDYEITGGTIKAANGRSVIYDSMKNTTVTVGSQDDPGKKPYFFTSGESLFAASSETTMQAYAVYGCYSNNNVLPEQGGANAFTKTGVTFHQITPVSDAYGNSYGYDVYKDNGPVYPGTKKEPVKIGNLWWAPVNCGFDESHPNGLLYQWGRRYGQIYDESRQATYSGPVIRMSDAHVPSSFIKDKSNSVCWYTGASANDTWTGDYNPCPEGWRVPTKSELAGLGSGSWNSGTCVFDGGLTFQAAGYTGNSGESSSNGTVGYYWSVTTDGANYAIYMKIASDGTHVYNNDNNGYRSRGMSVRCVKNAD